MSIHEIGKPAENAVRRHDLVQFGHHLDGHNTEMTSREENNVSLKSDRNALAPNTPRYAPLSRDRTGGHRRRTSGGQEAQAGARQFPCKAA